MVVWGFMEHHHSSTTGPQAISTIRPNGLLEDENPFLILQVERLVVVTW